jgi:DNA-binding MarR family transcriptional regulator
MRLMAEVPPRGIRPSELADRLGVTRSAVSQLVDYLERLGLLERTADATDRRAALVRQTASASSAQRVARQTIARIEQSWSDRLGAEAFAVLEQALEELRRWSLEQEPAEP